MKRLRQRLRDLKIKKQFGLLVALVVAVVLLIQVVYVRTYVSSAQSQAQSYFDSLSSQITRDLVTRLEEVHDTSSRLAYSENVQKYLTATDDYRRLLLSSAVKDSLSFSIASNSAISGIRLYRPNSTFISYGTAQRELLYGEIYRDYALDPSARFEPMFTDAYRDRYFSDYFFGFLMPVYSVLDGFNATQPIGMIFTLCSANIFSGLEDENHFPEMGLFIADESVVLSHNGAAPDGKKLDAAYRNLASEGHDMIQTASGALLIRSTPLPGTSFVLYCTLPLSSLTKGIRPAIERSILLSSLGVLLICGMSVLIFSNMLSPIERMMKEMGRIGDGEARLSDFAANEVGRIAQNINQMLDQLSALHRDLLSGQERVYEAELARVQTELKYLHNQINPHFLYNSLDCIRSIALVYGQEDIVTMSVALSRILRYGIQSTQMVTLGMELNLVKDYFSVVNIRHMNIHSLQVLVDESLREWIVPKMLLQPIVENSLHHGLKQCHAGGLVRIEARQPGADEAMVLRVFDSGAGMTAAERRSLNARLSEWPLKDVEGIGLVNIQRRIRLTYGPAYGIRVSSHLGKGTCVTVSLPMQLKMESHKQEG